MRNIKIVIEYDGTNYCGWQRQDNGVSVQGLIEKALKKITGKKVSVAGSSRTDSGVHALGQVANFKTDSPMVLKRLKTALNYNLPEDILVKKVGNASCDFNATRSAKGKIYRYTIYTKGKCSPFKIKYAVFLPYKFDITKMRQAAGLLKGKHDFAVFQSLHSTAKTSVRAIKNISVKKSAGYIHIEIEADGFLYNMARAISGMLVEVGRGKLEIKDVKKLLKLKKRHPSIPTLAAKGLTLVKVIY